MSIKNKIKLILLEKNMTQNELVERLNISKSTLSNIISGKQNATLETALDIAKVLKEPVEKIFYKEQIVDESKMESEFNELVVNMEKIFHYYADGLVEEESIRKMYYDMIDKFYDKYDKAFSDYIDKLPNINTSTLSNFEKMMYSVIFEASNDRVVSQL